MRRNMSYEIPLVLEIEKRPCLYNCNLPEYNRKDVLEEAWKEISALVNLTVYECKDKWKNIRSSFVRSLRTNGGKTKKPYYLTKYLQFLLPYLKPLGIDMSNMDLVDITDTSQQQIITEDSEVFTIKLEPDYEREQNDDPLSSMPIAIEKPSLSSRGWKRRHMPMRNHMTANQRAKYRKLTPTSQGSPRTENPALKYFLLSLLPELDTMDEDQVRTFKIKVMMLIDDIKSDVANVRADLPNSRDNTRLQKRLINLLLRNLEKNG